MDKVVLGLVGVVLLGIVVKLSSSARTERKLVMTRLAEEDDLRGPMPTERLFRETTAAGSPSAPVSGPIETGGPTEPAGHAEPAAEPPVMVEPAAVVDLGSGPVDVGSFFAGIQLPAGLIPWTGAPVTDQEASFTTTTPASQVLTQLDAELSRLGIAARWDAGSLEAAASLGAGTAARAVLDRAGHSGAATVYASAEQARDDDGNALFRGLPAGTCLVQLSV